MISIWKENGSGGLVQTAILEHTCWIQVVAPSAMEIETLHREYHIHPDIISDILDIDERSRCEREEDYTLIIARVPVPAPDKAVPYHTIPLGIILVRDLIITIALAETELLKELSENRVKNVSLAAPKTFVLRLMQRSTMHYLRYLKEINRKTAAIEEDLHRSIKNVELVRLLAMEKSLVYFTTSIRSNDLLLEKYAELIHRGSPDFIEAKAYMFVGPSQQRLSMENMPLHEEVVAFSQELAKHLPDYEIVSDHVPSRVVMFAKQKFKIDGVWKTWIDFPAFQERALSEKEFTALDYCTRTPQVGLSGKKTAEHQQEVKERFRKRTHIFVDEKTEEMAFYGGNTKT